MLIALAFVAASAAIAVQPVPVRFVFPKDSVAGASGTLTLRPAMGPGRPLTIPCCSGEITVDLPPNSAWEVEPRISGAWTPKQIIAVSDHQTIQQMKLWPVAHVKGRVQLPQGAPPLSTLAVDLLDVPARKSGLPAGSSAHCDLNADGTFQCEVPAAHLDLRFVTAGYVPAQTWDVDLRGAAARDVGLIRFRKGASVSGWIENGQGKATVALYSSLAGGGATAARLSRPIATANVLANGFFQLVGVPPGEYVLRADRSGYASEIVSPLRIYDGAETKIRKPLILRPPVNVTLSIVPAVDPRGEPWTLWVVKASPLSGGFDAGPLFRGRAEDGRVTLHAQGAGRFSVDVFDSAGNPLKTEQFDLDGVADATREIRLNVIRVAGTVSLGDAPLETTLWFGGRHGAPHVAVRSDAKGKFRTVLPHGGDWRVAAAVDGEDVETIATVESHDGEESVDVRLPDNHVAGVVVDVNGDGVAGAEVTLTAARASVTHRTGPGGEFRFRCVQAGDVSISASISREEKLLTSDVVIAKISADVLPPSIQLVLHEGQRLTGTVKSIHGPIVGAAVLAISADQSGATNATTDLEGHFKLYLPADANRAYVTVRAPGHALRVFDVPLPDHGVGLNVPLAGGTLDLSLPKNSGANAALLLFQDDRPLPLGEVVRWAISHGATLSDFGIHATDMAPAQYKACIGFRQLVRREELPRWIASARCTTGTLAPFGTLRLEIPAAPAR